MPMQRQEIDSETRCQALLDQGKVKTIPVKTIPVKTIPVKTIPVKDEPSQRRAQSKTILILRSIRDPKINKRS